jgi:hypothetical protein
MNRSVDHLRAARKPIPDMLPYDPRAAEFNDVDYSDVFSRCTPDPDEPRTVSEYYGGRS